MSEAYWAAAGPSRPSAASYAAPPAPAAGHKKKKRGRVSDGSKASHADSSSSIPSIVNPPSPELVPRHSSSASSWGIEDLSDSDGDYDWPAANNTISAATSISPTQHSPDLDRDELARFARPAKRVHLETPEDRQTYGKLAGMQIDPTAFASSAPHPYSYSRPSGPRANSGLAGAFGLSSSIASAFAADPAFANAPRVPPSSPTKSAMSASLDSSASNIYQQAVAPAPPTSPSAASRGIVPLSSPLHVQGFGTSDAPSKRANSAELEDSDMRLRRGGPTSYEVEPDRIVVTSLDDTSSSEADGASEAGGQRTPDADTSTESRDSSSDFVINNELIEKLEAHSRAVLTGTSDRDNAASSSRSNNLGRSRRPGRRSAAGLGAPSLGSLLSRKRGSTQSSPASSGYASPINAEDARGALILWKDPEEVLKSTATAASSPLKQSDLASNREPNFMAQPPVAFQSGSNHPPSQLSQSTRFEMPAPSNTEIPGMAALPSSSHAESPLYAQQSSLSSSYFPEPSPLETYLANRGTTFGNATALRSMNAAPVLDHTQQQAQHYGHHYSPAFQPFGASALQQPGQHAHSLGAQPIDLSGHFGLAEEMDLDS